MKTKALFILWMMFSFLVEISQAQDIFKAIQDRDMEQVKNILKQDNNAVLMRDKDKDMPLHFAASQGADEIAELLIEKGAPINTQNYQGFTPLHWAASRGHLQVTQTLLAHGANVHIKKTAGKNTSLPGCNEQWECTAGKVAH